MELVNWAVRYPIGYCWYPQPCQQPPRYVIIRYTTKQGSIIYLCMKFFGYACMYWGVFLASCIDKQARGHNTSFQKCSYFRFYGDNKQFFHITESKLKLSFDFCKMIDYESWLHILFLKKIQQRRAVRLKIKWHRFKINNKMTSFQELSRRSCCY